MGWGCGPAGCRCDRAGVAVDATGSLGAGATGPVWVGAAARSEGARAVRGPTGRGLCSGVVRDVAGGGLVRPMFREVEGRGRRGRCTPGRYGGWRPWAAMPTAWVPSRTRRAVAGTGREAGSYGEAGMSLAVAGAPCLVAGRVPRGGRRALRCAGRPAGGGTGRSRAGADGLRCAGRAPRGRGSGGAHGKAGPPWWWARLGWGAYGSAPPRRVHAGGHSVAAADLMAEAKVDTSV